MQMRLPWVDPDVDWDDLQQDNYPLIDFVTPTALRTEYTPDFKQFRGKKNILVFVFDDLQETHFGREFFDKDKYLGRGRTVTQSFRLVVKNHVTYCYGNDYMASKAIEGDIYAVSASRLYDLDYVMENTVKTKRNSRFVYALDQKLEGGIVPSLDCQMYTAMGVMPDSGRFHRYIVDKYDNTENKGVNIQYFDALSENP